MNRPEKKHFLRSHRIIGLAASILVIILVVTGWMLNHTERLKLDDRPVPYGWVLDWYEISPKGVLVSFKTQNHWISHLGGVLFFDGKTAASDFPAPVGATAFRNGNDFILAVAGPDQLAFFTRNGDIIDIIDKRDLPGTINLVGHNPEERLIADIGTGAFILGDDLMTWQPLAKGEGSGAGLGEGENSVTWAQADITPKPLADSIFARMRGNHLNMERLILDLHSGRFFAGSWGVLMMDLAALALLFLALSGAYNALRRDK